MKKNKPNRRGFIKNSAALSLGVVFSPQIISSLQINSAKPIKPIVISTWRHGIEANKKAWEILKNNGNSLDAVEQGVTISELDPKCTSVGYGGMPDRQGNVTLDACIMDKHGNCGSVSFLKNIKNAISVARLVMQKTPHVMLSGIGALEFAKKQGFKEEDLLTENAKKRWEEWKQVLTSKSIKNIIGNIVPKAYQVFGELGYQRYHYNAPSYFGSFQTYKAGLTGVWLKYKNKKVRTLLLSGNVRVTEGKAYAKGIAVNPSLFVGTTVVHRLKNFVVVGGYGSYFGNRFIGAPVLLWYHRFSRKWSSTMILPVQAKFTWSQSRKFKQELVVSYFGFSHAVKYTPDMIEPIYEGVNLVSGIRLSTQSKLKIGNAIDLYFEAGWQDLTQSGVVNRYKLMDYRGYDGSIFGKIRVAIAIGKALIKPKIFDFDM